MSRRMMQPGDACVDSDLETHPFLCIGAPDLFTTRYYSTYRSRVMATSTMTFDTADAGYIEAEDSSLRASAFSWCGKRGTAFASDIQWSHSDQLRLKSDRTGTVIALTLRSVETREGDVVAWHFESECGIAAVIFNT